VADADLQVASQDLAVRVTQAYFDVLGAQDVLSTAQANKAALAEQLAAAKRSFEVGNSTITDTREAQARHDLATAQELAAANELRVKRITLDQLVGRANVVPNPLRTPATLDSLAPGEMEEWVNQAQGSPNVLKASAGLEAAKLEIKRARAGHLPTLDAVASLQRTDIDSSNQLAKTSGGAGTSAAIGLEMNMSLYAGNSVQNRIAEVIKLQEKAEHDLDNAKRQVTLGTRQAYLGVQSGLAQVKAYEAAESSAKLALEATQLGYRVGVRINKDVLDAQTQLSNTQKDLFKSRYDVIVGSVKLRQASGVLTQDDLAELNKLLTN
jgi:outer membrane protein